MFLFLNLLGSFFTNGTNLRIRSLLRRLNILVCLFLKSLYRITIFFLDIIYNFSPFSPLLNQ